MTSRLLNRVISERNNFYGESLLSTSFLPQKENREPLSVSVVIPVYNSETSVLACLTAIEQSSFNMKHQNRMEVITVDDGSTDNSWKIVNEADLSLNLTAIRQANHGQAQALNTGISVASGDIIISCDSDMVLSYYTIEHFLAAYEKIPNALFTGFRQDTPRTDHRVNPDIIKKNGSCIGSFFTNDKRLVFSVPGWPSNMCLASDHFRQLGQANSLWMPDDDAWLLPDMVFGALFSLSRSVFEEIGGYDERLIGWGCTDSYLAAKAIGACQYIIPLYPASGLHMSHPIRFPNRELQYKRNRKLFFKFIQTVMVDNHPNWLIRAKQRITESFVRIPKHSVPKRKIKTLAKDNIEDKLTKIDQLLLLGQYPEALAYIKTKVKKNSSSPEIQIRLARAFSGLSQYKDAIYLLNKIILSNELLPEVKMELVINQAAEGNFESAQKTLKELARGFPQTPELSYWQDCPTEKHIKQGERFLKQKFHQIARRCFEAALITDPNNKTALRARNKCIELS